MLELSGQRWNYPDSVGIIRTGFWVPIIRIIPTPCSLLFNSFFIYSVSIVTLISKPLIMQEILLIYANFLQTANLVDHGTVLVRWQNRTLKSKVKSIPVSREKFVTNIWQWDLSRKGLQVCLFSLNFSIISFLKLLAEILESVYRDKNLLLIGLCNIIWKTTLAA